MENRLTFEVRSKEEPGSAVAVRATFRNLHVEVEQLVDPSAVMGPQETLRLVVNPHRKFTEDHDTYDFLLEGDLPSMEEIGKKILQAAKEFRATLKRQAGGA